MNLIFDLFCKKNVIRIIRMKIGYLWLSTKTLTQSLMNRQFYRRHELKFTYCQPAVENKSYFEPCQTFTLFFCFCSPSSMDTASIKSNQTELPQFSWPSSLAPRHLLWSAPLPSKPILHLPVQGYRQFLHLEWRYPVVAVHSRRSHPRHEVQ